MKKILGMVLSIVMCVCLVAPASAAEQTYNENANEQELQNNFESSVTLLSDVQLNIKPKTECQPTHKTPPNETIGGVLLCTLKRR